MKLENLEKWKRLKSYRSYACEHQRISQVNVNIILIIC